MLFQFLILVPLNNHYHSWLWFPDIFIAINSIYYFVIVCFSLGQANLFCCLSHKRQTIQTQRNGVDWFVFTYLDNSSLFCWRITYYSFFVSRITSPCKMALNKTKWYTVHYTYLIKWYQFSVIQTFSPHSDNITLLINMTTRKLCLSNKYLHNHSYTASICFVFIFNRLCSSLHYKSKPVREIIGGKR